MFKLLRKLSAFLLIMKNKRTLRKSMKGLNPLIKLLEPGFEKAASLAITQPETFQIPTLEERNNVRKGQFVAVIYDKQPVVVSILEVVNVDDVVIYRGLVQSALRYETDFNLYSFVLVRPEHIVDIGEIEQKNAEPVETLYPNNSFGRLKDIESKVVQAQKEMMKSRMELHCVLAKIYRLKDEFFNRSVEVKVKNPEPPPYCFLNRNQLWRIRRKAEETRLFSQVRRALKISQLSSVCMHYKNARVFISKV